jgi:hypothetical protein
MLLGTTHPIVAVVSNSMEHPAGSFGEWLESRQCCDAGCSRSIVPSSHYASYGITPEDFERFPFRNGFDKGDVMVLRAPEGLAIGDILVFWAEGRNEPIIHRIVQVRQLADGNYAYSTKGDNNCGSAQFEHDIRADLMIGKAVARIPFLGWIKIFFVELLSAAKEVF